MGTRLIFLGQMEVTDHGRCSALSDWLGSQVVPGNSSIMRSYPKPTQVDW